MRILIATMQLDIGGAETHIVELAKALSRRGIEVIAASNGGAYVQMCIRDSLQPSLNAIEPAILNAISEESTSW